MFCINCKHYDKDITACNSRHGIINRKLIECDFCSYYEPISNISCTCKNCVYLKSISEDKWSCENPQGLYGCVFEYDYCSSFDLFEKSK